MFSVWVCDGVKLIIVCMVVCFVCCCLFCKLYVFIVMFKYAYCYVCSVLYILFTSCQLALFGYPDWDLPI